MHIAHTHTSNPNWSGYYFIIIMHLVESIGFCVRENVVCVYSVWTEHCNRAPLLKCTVHLFFFNRSDNFEFIKYYIQHPLFHISSRISKHLCWQQQHTDNLFVLSILTIVSKVFVFISIGQRFQPSM